MRKIHKKICTAFLNKQDALYTNLRSSGGKLYSYTTVIAQWQADGTVLVTNKKYSQTTSRQMSALRELAKQSGITLVQASESMQLSTNEH